MTCNELLDKCIECAEGYTKVGWKCVSDNAVTYGITLDSNLTAAEYVNQEDYLDAITDILVSLGISIENAHTLLGITDGSVVVSGRIDSTAEEECNELADAQSTLSEGNSIGGNTILASSLSSSNVACDNVNSNFVVTIVLAISLSLLGKILLEFRYFDHFLGYRFDFEENKENQ